jgi:hypothetical protein
MSGPSIRFTLTKVLIVVLSLLAVMTAVRCEMRYVGTDKGPPLLDYQPSPVNPSIFQRTESKRRIALDVIANRCSLIEAAALFRELNRMPPVAIVNEVWLPIPMTATVRTDDERLCGQVINWVDRLLHGTAESDAVLTRLEREYRSEQAKPGGIRLPENPRRSADGP